MTSPLVPLAALGLGLYYLATRGKTPGGDGSYTPPWSPPDVAEASPVPLFQGVRYLFFVRLDPGVTEDRARSVLTPKGVEDLQFAAAPSPPPFVPPGEPYGTTLASFRFEAKGNSSGVTLGQPLYGIGRLQQIARLDARPFGEDPNGNA